MINGEGNYENLKSSKGNKRHEIRQESKGAPVKVDPVACSTICNKTRRLLMTFGRRHFISFCATDLSTFI